MNNLTYYDYRSEVIDWAMDFYIYLLKKYDNNIPEDEEQDLDDCVKELLEYKMYLSYIRFERMFDKYNV